MQERRSGEQDREGYRVEPAGGYEDPAQRPASESRGTGPTDDQARGQRRGRWPQASLMVAVLVLLFGGLAILAVLGFLASR
jgi:hypothetical protein